MAFPCDIKRNITKKGVEGSDNILKKCNKKKTIFSDSFYRNVQNFFLDMPAQSKNEDNQHAHTWCSGVDHS